MLRVSFDLICNRIQRIGFSVMGILSDPGLVIYYPLWRTKRNLDCIPSFLDRNHFDFFEKAIVAWR